MTDLNLGSHISAAVAALMTPEFIEKQVNARVEKLVTDAVDSALRSYSETGKMINKAVEEALRVDRLDLPSYGLTVTKILQAQIEACVSELVAGRLSEDMAELLSLAPKEIKLSEIADKMRQGKEEEYGEVITVIVRETEYGSTWLYLDDNNHYEDHKYYDADISILLSEDGTVFSASFSGKDMKCTRSIGRTYGLEQLIRAYHACGTKIIIDEDAVVTSVGDY